MSFPESDFPSDNVPPEAKASFNPDDFYRYVDELIAAKQEPSASVESNFDKAARIIAEISQDLEVNGVDLLPISDLYDGDQLVYSLLCTAYEKAKTSDDEYNGEYDRFIIMHRIRLLLGAYDDSDTHIDDLLLDNTVVQVFFETTTDDEAWLRALRVMFPSLGMFRDTTIPVSPDLLHEMARETAKSGDVHREIQNHAIYCAELYLQQYFGLHDETADLAVLIGVNAARRYYDYPVVFDIVNNPVNYLRLNEDQLEEIYVDIRESMLDNKD